VISVAMLSKWHVHATDYAREANQNPNLAIKKVWDEIPERGQAWAEELGVNFEPDLSNILTDLSIDAVIVDTPTNMHKDIIIQAAEHGKHIFTEKVLAFTVEECEEILAVVESAGVQLMVSLPRLTHSYYLYAQDVLDRGLLGKLTMLRCRLAHNGAVPNEESGRGWLPEHFFDPETCGGGALIDLGAHPIYLANRLAGPAASVTARLSSFLDYQVDDNAAVVVEYKSGALGVLEAGFVSGGSPFLLECHGTEGTVMIEEGRVRLNSRKIEESWVVPEKLPVSLPTPIEQWVNMIEHGTKPDITNEDTWRLTQINGAAALSNRESRAVKL
jgi:scyllo-inositol 2-dehydrogenase (NAD+)